METKNPLSAAQRASVEVGHFEALPSLFRPSFQALKAHHTDREAELDELCAIDPVGEDEAAQSRFEEAVDLHCEALNALMLEPAPNLKALRDKLRLFSRHELAKNWTQGRAIADMMARDAERLITWELGK